MPSYKSFSYALRGFKTVIKNERNAQIHLLSAILAVIFGIVFQITKDEFLVIILAIILVFFAEIINTAIEKTLDLTYQEHNHFVRLVKDISAAGVLTTAVGAIVVAIIIYGPHIINLFGINI